MIALDTTAASLLFVPGAVPCHEGKPIKYARERLESLIERIAKANEAIVFPTPVLSELLAKVPDKANELLKVIRTSPWFKLESFDAAAAVEVGLRTAKAIAEGDKREGSKADWTKVKFDRQIVAIAIVSGATQILSNDPDVKAIGARWGIDVIGIEDLPIPEELIPPPLIAAMEQDDEETQPSTTSPLGSGSGHPEGQAGAEASEDKTDGEEAGKE
jgi:predicted nucleic acid-binding protein